MSFNKNNNNNNRNNNRNNNNNYFTQEIQRNGKDFLTSKTPVQIQQDAPRIFREFSKKRISVESSLEYFKNIYFLDNCISYATTKYNYHSVSRICIQTVMNNRQTYGPRFNDIELTLYQAIFSEHQAQEAAHGTIMSCLMAFKQNTEDPSPLYYMVNNELPKYRNVL